MGGLFTFGVFASGREERHSAVMMSALPWAPTMSLRIPPSLAGSTVALLIASAVRVAEVRGLSGVVELIQLVVLVGIFSYALIVAERYAAHPFASIYFWPSDKCRKLLFMALLVALDCYLGSVFLLGGRLAEGVGV